LNETASDHASPAVRARASRADVQGFWGVWISWVLDGTDSVIFALIMSPALTELLPRSGIAPTAANVASTGSLLFAAFLVGWGLSFIWGPAADAFGRARTLAFSIATYSVFTGAAAFAQSVWELGALRVLAGIGIGGGWALAGTFIAETWPEDRRAAGAAYLQTGAYLGFFLAAALNYTVGVHWGWRAMSLCGLIPVFTALYLLLRVREPPRWQSSQRRQSFLAPWMLIWHSPLRTRTAINALLVAVAITGLWGGTVYEPSALVTLAAQAGVGAASAQRIASLGTALLSVGTILGCLMAPAIAERTGRRAALAIYFTGMALCIASEFGCLFYLKHGLLPFTAGLFVLGVFGGNFAIFTLWIPEQYPTHVRASAFALTTAFGRFVAAGVNVLLAWGIARFGSLGIPVALTSLAFVMGLMLIPVAVETKGAGLPA
jgi:MFS family permease